MRYDWQDFLISLVTTMSICIILGSGKNAKLRQVGNNRSHANNATKRTFEVNVQQKKYTLPSGKTVRVNISAKGIRILDKKGLEYLEVILEEKNNG